jgi:hypothetical protein
MTPSSPAAPAAPPVQTHACARCGAPVALDVGLCDRCNPLGLRDVAASQAHGTVFVGVAVGIVVLAILARLAVSGMGPFPAIVGATTWTGPNLDVTLTVTNEGEAAGQTNCRLTGADDRGGGPSAFVLSPVIGAGQTLTFSQRVVGLAPTVGDLVVDCRTP